MNVGDEFGPSEWLEISQERIDRFAEATDDHQWIHVDPDMAAQGPFGTTVAHGYLQLSLLPFLLSQVLSISDARMGINYGTEKVRFTAPVKSGSDVRVHARLVSSEPRGDGVLYRVAVQMEVRGEEKPSMVGEVVYLVF
jgi:acyl dehydratase